MEGKHRMTERDRNDMNWESGSNSALPRSFTPENRRKDGAMFRKIRERIKEGYYESGSVLRLIAEKLTRSR